MKAKVGRPKSKDPRNQFCRFRATVKEKNRIRISANLYAGGDESLFLRDAALNCRRKVLKKKAPPANG